MKTASVPRENYLILNYTVPMVADSNDETVLVHSLEIRLRNPNDSATFDVFKLDQLSQQSDFDCYLDAITKNQNRPCDFLDDSEKTFLNIQFNRKIEFLRTTLAQIKSSENQKGYLFVIDNTKFPENGANYKNPFEIEVLYHLDVHPSNRYYLTTELRKNKYFLIYLLFKVGISFGIIFIFSMGLLIYCGIKCKKHKKKFEELTEEKVKGF